MNLDYYCKIMNFGKANKYWIYVNLLIGVTNVLLNHNSSPT